MIAIRNMYAWVGRQVHNPYAPWVLGGLFFVEAICFIPVDPLLILFCIEQRSKTWFFASIATISSVLGGICSYFIGLSLWELVGNSLVITFFSAKQFASVLAFYQKYEIAAVILAGFTPLPYKLVTLTAGFCKLPLFPFIVCSAIARALRFFGLAALFYYWGPAVKNFIDRFFNILALAFFMFIIMIWLTIKYLKY